MTAFKVDLDELDHVVSSLETFSTALAARLTDLQSTVDALQQDWLGEAAEAQALAQARLAKGGREIHAAVLELHQAARQAHASYSAAVRANSSTWKQLR
ncbi:WXG100 family type VII secretion target [Nocardioides sp. BP30]|uniref:WXG100 family type VII secretion target n=1 Tax=Nocardioides sp. BP30 TaxID=3036374 RepID=UPI002468FCB4|nr:WXG100 family type VII secretion target [Nocardioides sp. BP30]WGL53949.1 WXG100 family type VII secretion target [Nocardioides sp. BP30]